VLELCAIADRRAEPGTGDPAVIMCFDEFGPVNLQPHSVVAFRRGFKAEANRTVVEVRGELGLSLYEALDPHVLAAWLETPIIDLSDFLSGAPAVRHLLEVEPEVFSAVTVLRRLATHDRPQRCSCAQRASKQPGS
jgi:hypothetical protein